MSNAVSSYPLSSEDTSTARPSAFSTVLTLVGRKLTSDKRVASLTGLWLFGLLAVFLLPAPVKITDESLQKYQDKMIVASDLEDALSAAKTEFLQSEIILNSERVRSPLYPFKFRQESRYQNVSSPLVTLRYMYA